MHVSLIPVVGKRTNSNSSCAATPSKGKDESGAAQSEVDQASTRSSGSAPSTLVYTTPEQERKLRSYSLDATTSLTSTSGGGSTTAPSTGGSGAPVARKADREALERQIREQRLQFDDRDLAEASARSGGQRGTYNRSSGAAAALQRLQQQQMQQQLRAGRYTHRFSGTGALATATESASSSTAPTSRYAVLCAIKLRGRHACLRSEEICLVC
jgi:hypothetical protein